MQRAKAEFRFLASILGRKRFWLALMLAATLASVLWAKHVGWLDPTHLVRLLEQHPTAAPIIFVAVYALMVLTMVPTLPMNLAAGFLWGIGMGTVYTVLGGTLGALIAFNCGRHLLREHVQRALRGKAWDWLSEEISRTGWKAVAFARINPVLPFGPLNWFFGICTIGLWQYTWATALFVAPPALFVSAIGASVGSVVLTGEARDLFVNVMTASAIITLLVLGRPVLRRYLAK